MMARSTLARALAPLLALGLGGCTVIADLDSYQTDRGCDLDLQMVDFSAHFTGPHRMEYFVVAPTGVDEQGLPLGTLASVLVLEPTPSIDFDIVMPDAVPNRDHQLWFYADTNNNGIVEPKIDGVVQDHTWILGSACDPQPNPFVHVFTFQDFERPSGFGTDMVVRFSNVDEVGGAFELRVLVALPDPANSGATIERTIGAFHKPERDDGAGGGADPFVVRIPGIVDGGVEYVLEAWADGNDNGVFDPEEDTFWRIDVDGALLDDPLVPFEFDVASPQIASQNDHSGVIVLTPR